MVGEQERPPDLDRILQTYALATVDSRGRICIPKRFLEEIQVRSGDKVYLRLGSDHIEIIKP